MNVISDQMAPTNVLIVGVGGQGVIMVSKVLARLCQVKGFQVKQSEVHGMAKRGGGVFSHVRFGQQVWSPTIPKGEVDILVALEWAEGLRWLNHLKRHQGTFLSDTQQIVPPFSCRDRKRGARLAYPEETARDVIEMVGKGFALDATDMASELGNAKAANTILLGALSTALDFALDDWLEVLDEFVPPKTKALNREAFLKGREWVENPPELPPEDDKPAPAVHRVTHPEIQETIALEITESWCKGCDICVKMCPQRCLALNGAQVATLTDPDACTACRLCEWLCPDFAIRVTAEIEEAAATLEKPQ